MMASKKILVEILNKSGPIPNICSIIAHNPDIVLFIIMNNPKGELTEKFDNNNLITFSIGLHAPKRRFSINWLFPYLSTIWNQGLLFFDPTSA